MKQLPQEWAEQGITYMSHSQLEKPACLRLFEYRYLKDERRDIPVGVPAIAGGSAHDAIQLVVCDGMSVEEATITALNRVNSHEPIDELDELKTRQYVEDIELIIENGVQALSRYEGTQFTPEERVSLRHSELAQEIMGFVDLTSDNMIVEIKTKWNAFGPPKKDGTRSPRQAKIDTITPSHVRQVAIYWAATGKMPTLVYITTQGAVTFSQDNCELLGAESLDYHFNQILHNAIVWENLLSISTDPHVLKYWIQPNWDDFRWRFMPNDYLNQAKELWKI